MTHPYNPHKGCRLLARKTCPIMRPPYKKGSTMKNKLSKAFWTLVYATAAYTVAQSAAKYANKALR